MPSPTVLVTSQHLVPEAQRILLASGARIAYMSDPIDESALVDRLSRGPVDAIVVRGPKPLTARVLAAAQGLKIIAKNGAGVDGIDLQEAARRNICVAVAPGANAPAVAEHTVAMMMALVRDLVGHDRRIRAGGWEGTSYQGRDFHGSVVGILGFGSIGQSTARLATALGAQVVVFDPTSRSDNFEFDPNFDNFLGRVDFLSLHCPLTEQTIGLVGSREIGLMKPGSFLINTARGAIVDERALADALRRGHLAGAGLDTFEVEPIAADNPLLGIDSVILTPHVAGVTRKAAFEVATTTARNVVDFLQGRTLPSHHVVSYVGSKA